MAGLNVRGFTGYAPGGGDATEAAIKQVRGPSILHVATHGFFLQDHSRGAGASLNESRLVFSEDPLLRSGLILAGANQRRSGAPKMGYSPRPSWRRWTCGAPSWWCCRRVTPDWMK